MVAAPSADARPRSLRSVAVLMIGLWLVQFAAQLCAAHCGVAAGADGRIGSYGSVAAGSGQPPGGSPDLRATGLPGGPDGVAGVDPAASDCPLAAVCELGQSVVLAARTSTAVVAPPPAGDAVVLPRHAAFLRIPEERPPAG